MNCPVCNTVALVMSERQGIEIDYCPQCRGVWLDRGELDKIIERAVAPGTATAPQQYGAPQQPYAPQPGQVPYPNRGYKHDSDHDFDGGYHGDYRKRKKRGFLGELFDF